MQLRCNYVCFDIPPYTIQFYTSFNYVLFLFIHRVFKYTVSIHPLLHDSILFMIILRLFHTLLF